MTRTLSLVLAAALTLGAVGLSASPAAATESGVTVNEAEQALDLFDAFAGELSAEEEAQAQSAAQLMIDDTYANHGSLEPLSQAVEEAALRALSGEDLSVVIDDFTHATPEIDNALQVDPPGDDWFDVPFPRWVGRIIGIIIGIICIPYLP